MIVLIGGIIISISLLIYFIICEIKASVFPRIGFIDNDIAIDKIKLQKSKEIIKV